MLSMVIVASQWLKRFWVVESPVEKKTYIFENQNTQIIWKNIQRAYSRVAYTFSYIYNIRLIWHTILEEGL